MDFPVAKFMEFFFFGIKRFAIINVSVGFTRCATRRGAFKWMDPRETFRRNQLDEIVVLLSHANEQMDKNVPVIWCCHFIDVTRRMVARLVNAKMSRDRHSSYKIIVASWRKLLACEITTAHQPLNRPSVSIARTNLAKLLETLWLITKRRVGWFITRSSRLSFDILSCGMRFLFNHSGTICLSGQCLSSDRYRPESRMQLNELTLAMALQLIITQLGDRHLHIPLNRCGC